MKVFLRAFKVGNDLWEITKVKKKKNHKIEKALIIKKRLANRTLLTLRMSVYGDTIKKLER